MSPALPDSTPPHVRAALADAKRQLVALYGDRLDRVVLYGSYARGDARPESDVDLLVVLRGEVEPYAEMKRMSAARLDLSLAHGADVSMQPYARADVDRAERPFLRHALGDGLAL